LAGRCTPLGMLLWPAGRCTPLGALHGDILDLPLRVLRVVGHGVSAAGAVTACHLLKLLLVGRCATRRRQMAFCQQTVYAR
jgi:hypothetical protein